MSKHVLFTVGAAAILSACGVASAVEPNGVAVTTRIFNDFPNSTLTVVNNFPSLVSFDETDFGSGNFANRHSAYFSTDGGATAHDFNYNDAFDISFTMSNTSSPAAGREAGFHTDLFGFGFFGALPGNGEVAAFGSILPFHSFGAGVWTPGTAIGLRMIYTPGDGDGMNPLPMGGAPSTIEYVYDIGGMPVSSGPISFTNTEGGIPQNFDFFVGVGVQYTGNNGGTAHTEFRNFVVPAPGAAGLLALGGLLMARRRR